MDFTKHLAKIKKKKLELVINRITNLFGFENYFSLWRLTPRACITDV